MNPKRDAKWLAFIASLPCASCMVPPPNTPHHSTTGRFSMSRKNPDYATFPLCHECHMSFHDKNGKFKGWTKETRRLWERSMVELYRPNRDEIKDSSSDPPDDAF